MVFCPHKSAVAEECLPTKDEQTTMRPCFPVLPEPISRFWPVNTAASPAEDAHQGTGNTAQSAQRRHPAVDFPATRSSKSLCKCIQRRNQPVAAFQGKPGDAQICLVQKLFELSMVCHKNPFPLIRSSTANTVDLFTDCCYSKFEFKKCCHQFFLLTASTEKSINWLLPFHWRLFLIG